MSRPGRYPVPHTPHRQARDARKRKRQKGRGRGADGHQVAPHPNPKPPPLSGRKSPPWMAQEGQGGLQPGRILLHSGATGYTGVVRGRDVPGLRRRRTCPAHTLRPPLRGRPGGCGGVFPNCGGWTIPIRTSSAQLEMLTHRCPLPRVKYCPHKTGHADCGRGGRVERTPPEDAGGDLTDAPDRGSASVAAPPALRLPQPLKRCSADSS